MKTVLNAPVHLKGAEIIADCFGVGRKTVADWAHAGAPIFRVGKKYQANYEELWAWLRKVGSRRGSGN